MLAAIHIEDNFPCRPVECEDNVVEFTCFREKTRSKCIGTISLHIIKFHAVARIVRERPPATLLAAEELGGANRAVSNCRPIQSCSFSFCVWSFVDRVFVVGRTLVFVKTEEELPCHGAGKGFAQRIVGIILAPIVAIGIAAGVTDVLAKLAIGFHGVHHSTGP